MVDESSSGHNSSNTTAPGKQTSNIHRRYQTSNEEHKEEPSNHLSKESAVAQIKIEDEEVTGGLLGAEIERAQIYETKQND